jgi:sugar/nucleoside kinase (ribokinase family)
MNKKELNFNPANFQYAGIIGTGGIGSGKFFQLNGNHTLGREESRSGYFLPVNDYCKQHIILHYVKILLGKTFPIIPIGKVGNDEFGNRLLNEMHTTGFIMDHVSKITDHSTLFSFCFYYPDGSGGNLTTNNSASSLVDCASIDRATDELKKLGPKGIIMAAPEVPFEARQYLIETGQSNGLFCAASFTSEEIPRIIESGIISKIHLLAIYIDEAAALAGVSLKDMETVPLIEKSIAKLRQYNKNIAVSVTAGNKGSWCWDGDVLHFFPSIKTDVKSTAGAGDAFFSGLLCGKVLALDIQESQQLATLIAGLSVQSLHTIHKGIDRESLGLFMANSGLSFSDRVTQLFEKSNK